MVYPKVIHSQLFLQDFVFYVLKCKGILHCPHKIAIFVLIQKITLLFSKSWNKMIPYLFLGVGGPQQRKRNLQGCSSLEYQRKDSLLLWTLPDPTETSGITSKLVSFRYIVSFYELIVILGWFASLISPASPGSGGEKCASQSIENLPGLAVPQEILYLLLSTTFRGTILFIQSSIESICSF